MANLTSRRWNQIINFVNNDRPVEELNPPANAEEKEIFDRMVAQLAEERKTRPQAAFFPVEKEEDDDE